MNYNEYNRITDEIKMVDLQMAELSVRLIELENELKESQKIGFKMAKKRGNPNIKPGPGRPKGRLNKKTEKALNTIRRVLDAIEGEDCERLIRDIDELKGSERVKLWAELREYVDPKLSRTEIHADIKSGPVKIGFDESGSE